MRSFALFLTLLPLPALGDTITVLSRATEATIYPNLGEVTHAVRVTLPRGSHQIVLPDMPPNLELDLLRVSAEGLRLGAARYRRDVTPPRTDAETEAVAAARAQIKQIEDQIQRIRDDAARAALAAKAAQDRITFLTTLGSNDGLPSDPESLSAIAAMISEQSLIAHTEVLDAEIASRTALDQIELLDKALAKAQSALDALVPESEDRPLLVLDVIADQDLTETPLRITFLSWDMEWEPTYTITLTEQNGPRVALRRAADITQNTGENWQDIRVTLSTQTPSGQTDPSQVWPLLRRIFDPADLQRQRSATLQADVSRLAEPVIEAPVIVEETSASTSIGSSGLALTYRFSDVVDVATGADFVRIPLDTLTFPAVLSARATPLQDDRAYAVATFTNSSPEPLLPAFTALRYFEDSLVGGGDFPEIAAGEEVEIGFGPINGLQLTRKILNRSEGDRGLISRSNEQVEDVRITAENLTDRDWTVHLRDRVAYSEQEDLQITYTASPSPTVQDVEDKRGVLEWVFSLPAGRTNTIETSSTLSWPDGQQLR